MYNIHSGFLKLAFTVSLLLCTSIAVNPANASLVDFNFAGSVASFSSGLPNFSVGQAMSGLIRYDDTTSDSNGLDGIGQYTAAITGGSIQFNGVGGYSATLDSTGSFINIEQVGTMDVYKLHAPVAGSLSDYFEITIIHSPSAFTNTLFPPSLGMIASAQFRLVFGDGGPKEVKGPLTAVPLPPAMILFGAGLVALIGLGARNWQRAQAEG
ncbi:MAG: hypothetical protein HZB34_09395 [Nitrospirae bacterium]|nr:hypothetical protein [Nitrospirota bacterium]